MVRRKTPPEKKSCVICFDNFRLVDPQSIHLEHRLNLAYKECTKQYLNSLASADTVICPCCRLPVGQFIQKLCCTVRCKDTQHSFKLHFHLIAFSSISYLIELKSLVQNNIMVDYIL